MGVTVVPPFSLSSTPSALTPDLEGAENRGVEKRTAAAFLTAIKAPSAKAGSAKPWV
jgi:hypothetical protein